MYVLSPGASINYEATSQFIDFLPANLRSRIELAVCLDGMVDSSKSWKEGQTLNVYESDSMNSDAKDRFLSQLERIQKKSTNSGVKSIQHKGTVKRRENNFNTQMTQTSVPFEHVIYAEKGIPAITLSASKEP